MKNINLMSLFFLLFTNQQVLTQAPADTYTVMSLNCYAFDYDITELLKKVKGRDLQDRTKLHVKKRIEGIAEFIKTLKDKPDLIAFQEIWLDENKEQMVGLLAAEYPYSFYLYKTATDVVNDLYDIFTDVFSHNVSDILTAHGVQRLNPLKVDSGLLIVSKYPFSQKKAITYSVSFDKSGTEDAQAKKGALMVRISHPHNPSLCFVTTHLAVIGKNRIEQMNKLGSEIKNFIKPDDMFVLAGDVNQAIEFDAGQGILVDKTKVVIDPFVASSAINIYNPLINFLVKELPVKRIIVTDDINGGTFEQDRLSYALNPIAPLSYKSSYFDKSTDAEGYQILDHVLLGDNVRLLDWRNFRGAILGSKGSGTPFDSNTALSDHAAIWFRIGKK